MQDFPSNHASQCNQPRSLALGHESAEVSTEDLGVDVFERLGQG
jgi:hypothetical protein